MTTLPKWLTVLPRWLAEPGHEDDVLGDLEEAHQRRVRRYAPVRAAWLTSLDVIHTVFALLGIRLGRLFVRGVETLQDYKLGLRMLVKFPGLTIAGGLALAIAIGLGAAWFDTTRGFLRPDIPLPGGDRLIQIEVDHTLNNVDERRLAYDLAAWRRDLRTLTDLGAYRSLERNLTVGDARPEPVTIAEISASAFRAAQVPPLFGRPLLDTDERPGASPVVVLGYGIWQQQFGRRADVIGQTVRIGSTPATIVGVMPEGFAFPVNHRLWMPLPLEAGAYGPLEGPSIGVFGRLAPGATRAEANAEMATHGERAAADSPATHRHLRPRVRAYGGESPGDRTLLELVVTHLPVLLVLLVACTNVGTLIYARTATREAEIAMRHALGANRSRIVAQLFVEALVLASVAAAVGLVVADRLVRWGLGLYYSGHHGGAPFWVDPGLKATTVLYAVGLTVTGAAILGVLPALRATSLPATVHLRNLGVGTSTLRFGRFWTAAMIGQVALTVICLPAAYGISQEAIRDREVRDRFPAREYLALGVEIDRTGSASGAGPTRRMDAVYAEFERAIAQEPGVRSVTFADRLPGMSPTTRTVEVESADSAEPVRVSELWLAGLGPRFLETFNLPLVAGRDFHEGDRVEDPRTILVNEAFARLHLGGASPIGRRVRFASVDPSTPEPWLEIVGMVRDVGLTPTDRGEAPYLFMPASVSTVSPLMMAVHVPGGHEALAPRVRTIAADLDLGLRLDDVRPLDEHVWAVEVPGLVATGAIVSIVTLALFLSAAGIFSLVSVSVARRTREIGLRAALGASRGRLVAGVLSRATALIGSGVAGGNGFLLFVVGLSEEAQVADVLPAVLTTSAVMLLVGLLACLEPARRALRIQPVEALKEG